MKAKIPKLTKRECSRWIKALKIVLQNYKKFGSPINGCPLCNVTTSSCNNCVWMWFTRMGCKEYRIKNSKKYKIKHWSDFDELLWVKSRMLQIQRWIKKLEEL